MSVCSYLWQHINSYILKDCRQRNDCKRKIMMLRLVYLLSSTNSRLEAFFRFSKHTQKVIFFHNSLAILMTHRAQYVVEMHQERILVFDNYQRCLAPLKTLDTIDNCQRLAFKVCENLWKFELNRSSKLRDNNERKRQSLLLNKSL